MISYVLTSELIIGVVWFSAISIELEESENHHLATYKDGGDAVVDVIIGETRGWVCGAGGAEYGEENLVGWC